LPTYVDTSALLRVVENRGDTSKVEAALGAEPITSSLAELECWTSLHKKWHDGELDSAQRDLLLDAAKRLLETVDLLSLDEEVVNEALTLTRLYPLRTLDGLHLATAAVAGRLVAPRGYTLRFCTADQRQAAAAERHLGAEQVDLVPPWR
jgi:predicted nucleic acid-binding protein